MINLLQYLKTNTVLKELPNILIVDDIPTNLIYLHVLLKGIEANLIEAESGLDALEIIEGIPLALAILDVQMAAMDGFELAIRINRNRQTNSVPIIFLTAAFPNDEQIITGYEAGAVDYLIKPINRKVLISKVNVFLMLFLQKQLLFESNEELKLSKLEVQNTKEQLQQLNHHLIDAREEERASISLLIHDELGQNLTAVKMDLSMLLKQNRHDIVLQKLDKIIAATDDIIRKVQRISAELHPKLLTDLGLADAIEWYCSEQQERTGLKFNLSLDGVDYKDFRTDLALFRILQEALTNVIRHAGAAMVSISIKHESGGTSMTIADDGIGVDLRIIENSNSMGLFGMKERARQCNGTLEVKENNPVGTKINVFIPTSTQQNSD